MMASQFQAPNQSITQDQISRLVSASASSLLIAIVIFTLNGARSNPLPAPYGEHATGAIRSPMDTTERENMGRALT